MPVIPQLAMGIQMPQVESPDLLRLMLGASQIQQAQRQAEMQQFQMAQALEQQKQEQAAQAYLKGRMQPVTSASTMADQVPAAPAGTYVQNLAQRSYFDQNLSPGNLAPPGETIYTRAPASMQPSAITSPPQPQPPKPIGWQEMVQFGKPGLAYAKLIQEAQDDELKRKEALMGLQLKALDHVQQAYAGVEDQASLTAANKALAGILPPDLVQALPQTYTSKADMDAFRARLQKQSAAGQKVGLELHYGYDEQGRPVPLQTSGSGALIRPSLPPGVAGVMTPQQWLNLGSSYAPAGRYGIPPGAAGPQGSTAPGAPAAGPPGSIPIDVRNPAAIKNQEEAQKAAATERLKALGKAGDTARDVHQTLDEVERILGEGVYEQSPTLPAALWAYKNGGVVPPGYDEAKLARTQRLRELGAQLTLTHGSLGVGVSNEDRNTYQRATGDFERGKTVAAMRESIKSMRTIANTAAQNANTAMETFRTTGQLPTYQTRPAQRRPTLEEVEQELNQRGVR